ncbi:MAG: hypothetical protein QOE11_275 [Solirubrobacteraceae bacterium]|jgi:predicted membrane channel-forming protein YqfA (hemolysin III family)|nr:hypothetical protein [Solirubrobacteraceae bacterium]
MRATLASAVLCLVLCIVLAVATTSVPGTVASIIFGGGAFVIFLAAAFYAVGASEDRERAAEARAREEA